MANTLEIYNILREFHRISGFRVSIHDAEFHEIYGYPKELSSYCHAIQTDPGNKRECIKTDRAAFQKVKTTGEIAVYQCAHGLFEAVAPIYHYGILSGFLMMGQVCDDKYKRMHYLTQSLERVVRDPEQLRQILHTVPEVPEALFDSYILIMRVIAEYITGTNHPLGGSKNQADLIMKYITQNYSSKISLGLLAEKFSCSQSMLVKCFRKEYGTTIMQALTDIRLKKAAEHLQNSRMSIKEIAHACGFAEQNYFSKVFFKKYHCAPSAYRTK